MELREDMEVIEVEDGRRELRHSDGTPEKCAVEIPETGFVVCPHGIQFVWASVLAKLRAPANPADMGEEE